MKMVETEGYMSLDSASFTLALRQTGFKEAVRALTFDFPIWPTRWVVAFSFGSLGVVLLALLIGFPSFILVLLGLME